MRPAGAAILLACLATATLAWAEQATGQATFRSKTEAVEVDVAVTRGGTTVAGLTPANFVVTDNGVVQDVTTALLAAEPLRLTLVLDLSKSVAGSRLTSLIKASRTMIQALRPEDQASLITFSHRVTSVVPMGHDRSTINDALSTLSGDGATALRDATYLGLATASDDHSRALLLLFSDGFDTASFLTEETVFDAAKRSNAVVHAVHFRPDAFLGRLAQITGGQNWNARSDRQLEELFGRVLDEMRARYLLTYTPSGPQKAGWHQIKVSLKGARGDVIAKQGYFVQ
jgi:Ca-activated chloride channel family protein